MRFNYETTRAENAERRAYALRCWHLKFAWLPVRVGPRDCRWLEYVHRRFPDAWVGGISAKVYRDTPEYRAVQKVLTWKLGG
jgi:hypothetical protein